MRHWILSICFLISASLVQACGGWYPFGEDVRFSLLHPQLFDDGGMRIFYYSADFIHSTYEHAAENDRNVDDWFTLAGGKVSKEDVFDAIYRLSAAEIIDEHSEHPFVKQMLALGKRDELNYLAFAKLHSNLNSAWSDPWEREEKAIVEQRSAAQEEAITLAKKTKDPVLQRRYAYQAIRFAFYNGDQNTIAKLYQKYFQNVNELSIDKWAHYFYLHQKEASPERNFHLTQLFADIPSKRHGIFNLFSWKIPIAKVLPLAKTDKEKARVIATYATRERGRCGVLISKIYDLDPTNELLTFLLVRELNKLEDWVLGPTYTTFAPVMREGVDSWGAEDQLLIRKAVNEDKEYAQQFLSWIEEHQKALDPELGTSLIGSLKFIMNDPAGARETLRKATFKDEKREKWRQRMVGMLSVITNERIESVDLDLFLTDDYVYKDRFIFMIGRLFEHQNELEKAALFYSQLNREPDDWQWFVWAETRGRTFYNITFYSDYFDYFDANYCAEDVAGILAYAESLTNEKSKGLQLLAEVIVGDKDRLTDLIGTKYLREDELNTALLWLKKVPASYWKNPERHYDVYLAANPFYTNFYAEHKPTDADTIVYTKYEIAKRLSELLEQSADQTGDQQAKTIFLIANCYFNMTTHGNSWMMRRSWWSANVYNTVYVDSDEFNKCLHAKAFYLKAFNAAESSKFKALCLRMAGRCEKYRLYFDDDYDYDKDYDQYGGYGEYIYQQNKFYNLLKKVYPEYQEELLTNCYSFNRYYNAVN